MQYAAVYPTAAYPTYTAQTAAVFAEPALPTYDAGVALAPTYYSQGYDVQSLGGLSAGGALSGYQMALPAAAVPVSPARQRSRGAAGNRPPPPNQRGRATTPAPQTARAYSQSGGFGGNRPTTPGAHQMAAGGVTYRHGVPQYQQPAPQVPQKLDDGKATQVQRWLALVRRDGTAPDPHVPIVGGGGAVAGYGYGGAAVASGAQTYRSGYPTQQAASFGSGAWAW